MIIIQLNIGKMLTQFEIYIISLCEQNKHIKAQISNKDIMFSAVWFNPSQMYIMHLFGVSTGNTYSFNIDFSSVQLYFVTKMKMNKHKLINISSHDNKMFDAYNK